MPNEEVMQDLTEIEESQNSKQSRDQVPMGVTPEKEPKNSMKLENSLLVKHL